MTRLFGSRNAEFAWPSSIFSLEEMDEIDFWKSALVRSMCSSISLLIRSHSVLSSGQNIANPARTSLTSLSENPFA